MNHLSKRIFSLCMVAVMLVMLIPQAAFAAPDIDPDFSVEYHAWVTDYADKGKTPFEVIDTTGGKLPSNKDVKAYNLSRKTVYFDETGIQTKTVLSKIFKDRDGFSYYTAPGLHYIDEVSHFNGNYLLKEIWLSESGKASGPWTVWTTASAPSPTGWTAGTTFAKIADLSSVMFSNDASKTSSANLLVLKEGSVIRLVYDTVLGDADFNTKVFDYDITNGKPNGKVLSTHKQGINSHGTLLGFGNANTDSGLASNVIPDGTNNGSYTPSKGTFLNRAAMTSSDSRYKSQKTNIQQGAYGIPASVGLTSDGLPKYSSGITAPDLFSDEEIAGKTVVPGNHTLTFANHGDLYEISKATIADKDGTPAVSDNLSHLRHPHSDYTHIWTNNFFPLDNLSYIPGVDPEFGKTAYTYKNTHDGKTVTGNMPGSDDKTYDHNCFFGLTYDVDFTLDADYVGPMNYLFFGDDDLWLYLIKDGDYANAKLVCDIGGVHSAIGEYVDLWDYIEGGREDHDSAEYTLRFFYTERGASGSTFYMSFVLPQVHPITPMDERGSLKVEKEVKDVTTDEAFDFQIKLSGSDKLANEVYSAAVYETAASAPNYIIFNGGDTLKVQLKDTGYVTISDLPAGVSYAVTETANEDYVTTKTGDTGTIKVNEVAEAKFVNTYREGTLTVSKTVVGDMAEAGKAFQFTVTLDDTSINGVYGGMTFVDGVATFTLKHGESKTATDLPADITYTVTEAAEVLYDTTSTGTTGTIEKDKTATAAFTNTFNAGKLTVSKTVTGTNGDKDLPFQFTVTLSEALNGAYGEMTFVDGVATFTLKDGQSITAENLPDGITYTVVETADEDYTTTYTGETGTIEANKTAEADVVNDSKEGDLIVTKTVEGESADYQKKFSFTVALSEPVNGTFGDMVFVNGVATVFLSAGQSATAVDLPEGVSYTVTEEVDEDYITTSTGETGTIVNDQTAEANFLNVYREGSLTVTKSVTGEWADYDKAFDFTVTLSEPVNGTFGDMTFVDGVATFALKNGESATALYLPADVEYTVAEAVYDEYLTTSTGETGVIVDGETAAAAFINHYDLGSLIVTKTVTGEWGDLEKEFAFTVVLSDIISGTFGDVEFVNGVASFTLKNGESVSIVGLPGGVSYTVIEESYDEYLTTSAGESGVIVDNDTVQADFVNHYNVGNLVISKTVEGESADYGKEFEFAVILSEGISGVFGDLEFVDGVASFTLKDGESVSIVGLPDGVEYSVIETADEDYITSSVGEVGTIAASTTAETAFLNVYREGDLTVSKTVTGDEADFEKEFSFTVTLSEAVNGTFGDMIFVDGVATFTLKHGESVTALDLPADVEYTVTEAAYEDYFPSVNGEEGDTFSGVIDDQGMDTVDFVNHIASDAIVELDALKTVDGKVPGDMIFDFILVDEEMNILQVQQNDADGVVTFDPLVFDAEGTYLYAIFENVVDDPAMDFDQSIYVVIVNVTLGENYEAEVIIVKDEQTYEGDMIFNNETVELTELTVTKVWSGDGGNHQPDSILVQLYCNGEAYGESVELSAANEWTYTWTELRAEGNIWEVDEVEVPENYHKTVTYDQEADLWTITNEYVPETGDNTPVALLTAAMVLSLIGICAIVLLRRKRT